MKVHSRKYRTSQNSKTNWHDKIKWHCSNEKCLCSLLHQFKVSHLWATLTALRWSNRLQPPEMGKKNIPLPGGETQKASESWQHMLHTSSGAKHTYAPPASERADLSSASLHTQNVLFQWHSVTNYFSLIWHKPWERMPLMARKILSERVILFPEMMTETDHFTWHK